MVAGQADRDPIGTIAVGTDGSETADAAVAFAVEMAAALGSRLVIATCYKPVREDRLVAAQRDAPAEITWSINPAEDADTALRAAEERAEERGLRIASEARMGDPATVLCEVAHEYDADVLIVGNKGMHRKLLGSIPNTVSHQAPCSVLIVKTT